MTKSNNPVKIVLLVVGLLLVAVAAAAGYGSYTGADWFSPVIGFFAGFSPEELLLGLAAVVFGVVPKFGVAVFDWLKNAAGVSGKHAVYLIYAFCYVFAAIALFVTGTFEWVGFSLVNLLAYANLIFGLATVMYKKVTQDANPDPMAVE